MTSYPVWVVLAGLVSGVGLFGCAVSPTDPGDDDPNSPGGKADAAAAAELYANQESVLEFSLDAPLTDLFATGQDLYNRKHDNDPNNDQKLVEMGTLTWTNPTTNEAVKIPVSVELHGNTALFDCDFRKLNISFDKTQSALQKGTPFEGVKKFMLRTHCGDHPVTYRTPTYGRVSNEISVRRETFVYKTLQAMDVASHRTRMAKVHYTDGAKIDVTRNAFLLEDTKQMAKRLGGEFVDPAETQPWSDNPDMDISIPAMARVALAQNLVGNFDWTIDRTGKAGPTDFGHSWNFEVVTRSPTDQLLIPYDFDLSEMVTLSSYQINLSSVVGMFGLDVVKAQVASMKALQPRLINALQAYPFENDAAGVQKITKLINGFFTSADAL